MKIGVIYCAYNTKEYVSPSLEAWVAAKKNKLNGNEFYIYAVSHPFKNFFNDEEDGTQELLEQKQKEGSIDFVSCGRTPRDETDVRWEALNKLINLNIDYAILVDSDEFYTTEEISRIFGFVQKDSFIGSFKICLKNYVFDESTYLVEPFCPPRVFKINVNGYQPCGFWDDNNVEYHDENGSKKLDRHFSVVTIPKKIAFVKHLTWLSNERSKKKCLYQASRNWVCSFNWDEAENRLEFNKDYFLSRGETFPEIAKEDS